MDDTAVALIASCCVLLAFIIGASLILAYKCFRHLEARKFQRLSSSVQRDVAIWAMSASNDFSMYGAGADHPSYLTDYRPKIYGAPEGYYIPDESYRESDPRKRGHERKHRHERHQDHVTTSTQRGHSVSVINVRDQTPGRDDTEIVSSNHVVSGHIYTLPTEMNGEVVYGRPSRRLSEDDLQVTRLQKTNNVVQGYIVENGTGTAGGRGLVSSTMVQHHERGTDSRQRGEVVHGQVVRPELVRGHVIKQHVEVGEDGKFVVSSSRQLDIYDQNIPDNIAASSGGPQIVYGHYSTHRDGDDHRSLSVTEGQKHDVHSSVPAARNITDDHWPNSMARALEGIAAAGVSVTVPHIIVTETLDHADARSFTGSDVSDDNASVKQKKDSVSEFVNYKDNYKVIKKHSVHKIPDWVIKTISEKGPDADSNTETRETLFQLEHRLSTSQDPSDFPNTEKRPSNASITTNPEVRTRRQGVTFGSTTHILDAEIIEDERSPFEMESAARSKIISEGDLHPGARAYSTVGGGGYMMADFIKPADVETNTTEEVRVNPDGSTSTLTTTTTAVRQVRHIVEVGEPVPSSELSAHRSSIIRVVGRDSLDGGAALDRSSVEPPADYHM